MALCGRWFRRLPLAGALAALAACNLFQVTQAGPPAAACYDSIPSVATLRGLPFDPVFGAADTQYVDFVSHVLGQGNKRGWIQPQTNTWSRDLNGRLKAKQSCVIARFGTDQAVAGSPFFGARQVYWVVTGDPDDSIGKTTFVPDSAAITQHASGTVWFNKHPRVPGHSPWGHAIARFKRGSLVGWSVCGDMCCESTLQ